MSHEKDQPAEMDLDELSELPDLDEIPELPDDSELNGEPVEPVASEPSAEAAAPAPAAVPASAEPSAAAAAGEAGADKPPLRVLDKAPLHLRKAAMIAVAGSLLPWMGHGGTWLTWGAAKVVLLFGVFLWFKQVEHNWGPKLKGVLGTLGELSLKPKKKDKKDDKRKSRKKAQQQQQPAAPTALAHPFPTGLHILSLLVVVAGCVVLPLQESGENYKLGIAIAELGMLAWAAFTWVHIHSYERWGQFNPLFPLMFLAMLIGGFMQVIGGLTGGFNVFSVLGGAVVAAGGGLAAYVIVLSLRQAKKEGDLKKQQAIEQRKAAREARKSARAGD